MKPTLVKYPILVSNWSSRDAPMINLSPRDASNDEWCKIFNIAFLFESSKYSDLIGCSTYPSIGCFSHWNIFIGMMFFEQIAHFINCIEMFNFPVTVTINLSNWPWMTFDVKWPLTLSKPPHSFWDMLNLPYSIEFSDSMSNLYFPVSIPPPSGEYA